MKFRVFLIYLLLVFIIVGCSENNTCRNEQGQKVYSKFDEGEIVVIDNCEYIKQHTYGAYIYVHKGNCRFCQARLEETIRKYHLEKDTK